MNSKRKIHLTLLLIAVTALGGVVVFFGLLGPTDDNGPDAFPEIVEHLAANRVARALASADEALSRGSKSPWLIETAARLHFEVGEFEQGESLLRGLMEEVPEPARVLVNLAGLLRESSRHTEAAKVAEEALRMAPETAGARAIIAAFRLRTNRYEEARDLLAARVKTGAADRDEQVEYARALSRLGQHCEAARILERNVTELDGSSEEHCLLAEARIGCGEFQAAADDLARLLESRPLVVRAYYLMGTALARLGRREAASPLLNAYSGLAQLDLGQSKTREMDSVGLRNRACYEKALLFVQFRQFRLAFSLCMRAAALDLDDGPVLLATVQKLLQFEAFTEAREILERSLSRNVEPKVEILALLGELHRRSGQLEVARTYLDRALAAKADTPNALLWRAHVGIELQEPVDSVEAYLKRVGTEVPSWELRYWFGRTALQRGDFQTARSRFAEAREAGQGPDAEWFWGIGYATLGVGVPQTAVQLFLEAVKEDALSVEGYRGMEESFLALKDSARAEKSKARRLKVEAIHTQLEKTRASGQPFESHGRTFLQLAQLCREAGAQAEFLRFLYIAVASAPDEVEIHRALANALNAPTDVFLAIHEHAEVLRLQPDDNAARTAIAWRLARLGVALDRALTLARASLSTENVPEHHHVLGEVLLARGELDEAAREAQAALAARPDDQRFQDLSKRVASAASPSGSTGG